jgi:hypothetical protein
VTWQQHHVCQVTSHYLIICPWTALQGKAVKALLAHRLSSSDPHAAKHEWYRIVEGQHPLWQGVSEPYKHVIRAFLVHFNTMILSHSSLSFDFSNGSIGGLWPCCTCLRPLDSTALLTFSDDNA